MKSPASIFLPVLATCLPCSRGFQLLRQVQPYPTRSRAVTTRLHYVNEQPNDEILERSPSPLLRIQPTVASSGEEMRPLESTFTKLGMITFIVSMCVALPLALLPTLLLYQSKVLSKKECEISSHQMGQLCSKWLLQMIPFINLRVFPAPEEEDPEPSIWVCNHISMLDIFVLLAADEELRGKNKRPIKSVYWKGLDENPVCKLLFHMSGFIPVQMAANGSGNPNEYDRSSFKSLLKETKKAMDDGFDVLVLPEGQLNPWPERGLLPVFPGAYKLACMSRRPIRMAALYGLHRLWHPDDSVGMTVTGRDAAIRAYPPLVGRRSFGSGEEFVETFRTIVGHFGAHGEDLPPEELECWLDGMAWREKQLHERVDDVVVPQAANEQADH